MDDELHSMALIRALPDEYKSLSQSLMLLDNLNKTKIREAIFGRGNKFSKEGGANYCRNIGPALFTTNSTKLDQECDFCGSKGHTSSDC